MLWTLFSSPLWPALHPHLFIPSLLYVPINKGGGGSPSCWEFHFQLLTLLPLLGRSTGKHAGQYPFRGKGLKSSCDSFHSIWRLCLDEFFLLEFYLDVSEGFLCFRGYKLHIIKYGNHLLLPTTKPCCHIKEISQADVSEPTTPAWFHFNANCPIWSKSN